MNEGRDGGSPGCAVPNPSSRCLFSGSPTLVLEHRALRPPAFPHLLPSSPSPTPPPVGSPSPLLASPTHQAIFLHSKPPIYAPGYQNSASILMGDRRSWKEVRRHGWVVEGVNGGGSARRLCPHTHIRDLHPTCSATKDKDSSPASA